MRLASAFALRLASPRLRAAAPSRGAFSGAVHAQLERLEARHAALQRQLSGLGPEDAPAAAGSAGAAAPAAGVSPRDLPRLAREAAQLERVVASIRKVRAAQEEVSSLEALVRDAAATHSGGGGGGGDSDAPASSASASASSSAGSGETCGQGAAAELAKMAEDELAELRPALAAAEARLVRLLLPADEADARDAILEVRMGVGGEESCLFAGELLAMYEGYAALKGWKWKLLSSTTEQGFGGIREAVVSVESSGGGGGGTGAGADEGAPAAGAFGRLRFESGVHRVQRVPVTQSTGKLQTSTATVAVLPEAEEVDIELRAADLRIDTYRAGGPGGQGVNTTDSAVRITHLPTGLVVAIQDERSQIQNRAKALRVLRARLFDAERERNESARREARSAQVGSSARSERVRTYNFSQNRVTDHRCGESRFDIAAFMRGEELDGIIDALAKLKEEEELGALEARHKAESAGQEGSKAKGKK